MTKIVGEPTTSTRKCSRTTSLHGAIAVTVSLALTLASPLPAFALADGGYGMTGVGPEVVPVDTAGGHSGDEAKLKLKSYCCHFYLTNHLTKNITLQSLIGTVAACYALQGAVPQATVTISPGKC